MGLFGAVASLFTAGKQRREARAIHPVNTTYEESQYIKSLYGAGKNLYQGRMAGASQAEQNILTEGANTNASVARNATDASQALAIGAGVQGQTDQSLNDLAVKEAQDKQNRFGIYSNVSQLMTQEGDKVYQDKLRNYYDDLNYKRALQGAADQNQQGFWNGLDDTVMAGVSLFTPGGLLAGTGGGGNSSARGRNQYTTGTIPSPRYPTPNMNQPYNLPIPRNTGIFG